MPDLRNVQKALKCMQIVLYVLELFLQIQRSVQFLNRRIRKRHLLCVAKCGISAIACFLNIVSTLPLVSLKRDRIYIRLVPHLEPKSEIFDVFNQIRQRRVYFFRNTGETPESFLNLVFEMRRLYCQIHHVLHVRNFNNNMPSM